MLSLAILVSALILLVIAKVAYTKLSNTVSNEENVQEQTVAKATSHNGVIYIFPKHTLNNYQRETRRSMSNRLSTVSEDNTEDDISQGKHNRMQQILQANPPRQRKPAHQISVKEWMKNDCDYQELRKRLRTG